ncbi:hypothetical protein, partial [Agrobacterium tumefaciens]|uniref:hypothetical protein n=1 Tax=Agrobacterium tumefaciens TaxID=358 RepID=UPI001CBDD9AA
MEGAPVRFRAIEDCEASGIPIPAGAYFGKEKIHTADDRPATRAFHYSLDMAEKGKCLDVTPLVVTCHCEFPPEWIRVRPIKGRTHEEAAIYGRADYCGVEGAGGWR